MVLPTIHGASLDTGNGQTSTMEAMSAGRASGTSGCRHRIQEGPSPIRRGPQPTPYPTPRRGRRGPSVDGLAEHGVRVPKTNDLRRLDEEPTLVLQDPETTTVKSDTVPVVTLLARWTGLLESHRGLRKAEDDDHCLDESKHTCSLLKSGQRRGRLLPHPSGLRVPPRDFAVKRVSASGPARGVAGMRQFDAQ